MRTRTSTSVTIHLSVSLFVYQRLLSRGQTFIITVSGSEFDALFPSRLHRRRDAAGRRAGRPRRGGAADAARRTAPQEPHGRGSGYHQVSLLSPRGPLVKYS